MLFLFFFILISISLLVYFIEIKVKIENFEIGIQNKNFDINKNGSIIIKFKVLNKINLFKIKTSIDKFQLPESKNKYYKIKNHVIKNNNIKINDIQKKLKLKYENIKLNIEIGEDNAAITALLTGVISCIVSVIIGKYFSNIEDINWNVQPMYNINILKLSLNCIISVKLIHIINTIYEMRKEGDKYARTSNRKDFEHVYE